MDVLLLTVKKNKESFVIASVEGRNNAERVKDMFMSFEQGEGQNYSLKITGKCGNFKYLGKTLTSAASMKDLDQIKFRECLILFDAKSFVTCFDI